MSGVFSISEPSALGLRCSKRSHPFFPVAPRRPGVRMLSSRLWRVSRQASPLLSLPPPSTCTRIHRLNSRSPHSDLSHPPLEVWCAERVHPHFSSDWQLGDASGFPPLQSILLPPAGHVLGDTVGSLLQRTDHVPAIFQSSTSLSIIPNKDAEGFPSWWRASLLPGLLDTPTQACLPLHDTLLPLSHFIHEWELSSLLQKGAIEENTSVGHRTRVFQPLLPCSKKGRRPEAHSGSAASEFFPLQREVQDADNENYHVSDSRRGLVCHYRPKGCIFSHPGRSATQEVPSVCLWREGLPIQRPSLRPGLGYENVQEMHGCCTGPFEVSGHSCSEVSGRLAHSDPLQGVSQSSQRYHSLPHSFYWPQNERQEKCALPISANRVFGGSLGFHSDAGPFGSCPDIQFYSMSGPLQARPSCLGRYLPQAARPHGSGLSCVAPRVASHEAVPLVDERAETTSHDTSHSRRFRVSRSHAVIQIGVRMGAIQRRHMITTDASMTGWGAVFEGRPASREWRGEFLSWHINCLELGAVFLALIHFLPVLGEHHIIVRMDNMAVVSHINRQGGSQSCTLDRLARRLLLWSQDKFLSLRAVHVPGMLNLAADFLSRQKLRPG